MTLHPDIAAVLAGESRWCVITGDCLAVLPTIPAGSIGEAANLLFAGDTTLAAKEGK